MARTKAPTHELQRSTILDAAAKLFAQKGFHNASMAELAKACGVSKPLLYHYYRDKEHILFDIADSYMDRLLAVAGEVADMGLEAEPHFRELVMRFMEEYQHSQNQHMVLVQDVKFLEESHRRQVVDKERRVVAAFVAAIAAVEPGVVKAGLEKAVAMILFGMINWTFTWLSVDGPLTYRDMAPVVAGIFLGGVRNYISETQVA